MAIAKSSKVKGAYSASTDFISLYDDGAGTIYRQNNKIVNYAGSSTPDRIFSVEGTTPPILVCDHDTGLGCDMVSLQAESFDAATIAAFDALVASGIIPNLSVDKTDPTKPVIKFPASNIKLTESADGRGFCLTAGTGSDIVTVDVSARGISVKSSSGIDAKISHPDANKTFNLELSTSLVKDCFDATKSDRIIQKSVSGAVSPISSIGDLSPEFAVALAQTAVPSRGASHASINYGNLEFLVGYDIKGKDAAGGSTTNNIILVKEHIASTPPTTKTYLLHSGKFHEVNSTTFVYGNFAKGTHDVGDISICFNAGRNTIEMPVELSVSFRTGSYTKNKNTKFFDSIIKFTQSSVTSASLVNPSSLGAPATYHGISIARDDGTRASMIKSRVKFSTTDISDPTATPPTSGSTPPTTPPAGGPKDADKSKESSGHTNATTTKKISGLDKAIKSFGQLGLMTGFFLFVGAVLMPALLPAAIGVLAAGAGLYLGSNMISSNYDITLNKVLGDQAAREAKREKDQAKFMDLEAKLDAANSELAVLECEQAEYNRLNRLKLGGELNATEAADLTRLKALKASGAITAADQSRLDLLERLERGLLSATELADFRTLDAKRTSGTLTDPAERDKLATLDRLKKNGALTPREITKLTNLRTLKASGAITAADQEKLDLLERLECGHLSTDEKNKLTTLAGSSRARSARIRELKTTSKKLEDKNYLLLANTDFKTILAIKSQIGAQAEKDEERKLRAAFDAAHATTPATPDEIKHFNESLPTKKKAARVAAEKDFISKNEYSITRNIMENARDKKAKQFIADLSNDERSYITHAADDIDAERLHGTKTAKITGPDIVHPTRRGRFNKLLHASKDKKAKDLESKLSKAPSTPGSPSYKTTWLKTFITRHEGYEKAKEALDAAGASDSKLKAWATARKIFNDEMGKSRDARILESTRASATAKAKAQTRIQNRRNKAGIDMTKFVDPEEYGK